MQFGRGYKENISKFHKQLNNGQRLEVALRWSGIFQTALVPWIENTSAWSAPRMVGLPITIIRMSTAFFYWQCVMPSTVSL